MATHGQPNIPSGRKKWSGLSELNPAPGESIYSTDQQSGRTKLPICLTIRLYVKCSKLQFKCIRLVTGGVSGKNQRLSWLATSLLQFELSFSDVCWLQALRSLLALNARNTLATVSIRIYIYGNIDPCPPISGNDVGKHLKPGWSGPRYVHCKICRSMTVTNAFHSMISI